MTVSVVIPAYNAPSTIARALDALSAADFSGTLETIVIDDVQRTIPPLLLRVFPGALLPAGKRRARAARNHGRPWPHG